MRKRLPLFISLFVLCVVVSAHQFWLEPNKFYFKAGEYATVNFRVGENFLGDVWQVKADRIVRMEHHGPDGVRDLRGALKEDTTDPFELLLKDEGTHTVVVESDEAFIDLEGQEFTEYLEEYGLDEVLYQREKAGISAERATEQYSRHSKLFLQSGLRMDDSYKKIYNLPIEIVAHQNPAGLKKGDPIAFKILFQGKPLFGAKVRVLNRFNHRTSVQNIFSQQDGVIETHVSNPGTWMVSVVKIMPSHDPKAMYRSYWGTTVFGVR